MNIQLKVTPEQLKAKASEVSAEIKEMQSAFEELASIVSRTSVYWLGEAGDCHRRIFEGNREEVEIMIRRLKEHPADLLQMADLYEKTEEKIQEATEALPADIIS